MRAAILVGVDRSEASRRAVAYACERAGQSGARLLLAHVVPSSPYASRRHSDSPETQAHRAAEIETAQERVLGPLRALAGDMECQTVVRHGHPAQGLVALAREHRAREIVVGRTGESRLRTAFFGSVASQLVQLSDVPVTVVP